MYDRIFIYERRLLLSVLLYILFAIALIAYANFNNAISTLVAFAIGLITTSRAWYLLSWRRMFGE